MDFEAKSPDEIINQFKNKFKWKGPKFLSGPTLIIAIVLVIILVSNIFYTISPNEVGVVLRFGKYVRTTQPGLHFKIPFVEAVTPIKTKYVYKQEFGYRTAQPGIRTRYSQRSYSSESLMLTGDLNVLDLEWIVQFRVKDPYKILYNIRNPERTLRDISEAVMRQVVGDYTFTEVLTLKRIEVNNKVQKKLQEILNDYGAGIHIVTVKLQDVNPPDPVKPAFNEVNEAKQQRETLINQAWKYYNQKIPQARGKAKQKIQEAEGYGLEVVNNAQGDAKRFLLLYNEYAQAKNITKKRIYLDHLSDVLQKAGKKYIVDPSEKGILPMLRLDHETK
ncbi:MAG: FtsH protease activity modulator HflK [Candidatus Omnitrophica bacterium]|nr:FtsH protease activity modulator HflK [Candidatus Omnitrophota bacterium]MCF7877754.1 FtsH protease activity modulator HflK [Candidatus Omnitrophota bacterium]MCF7878056.1 FtsH protease activity modulator HflK [Candidatus Omnitrophota bacterium]MCF7892737.1 FtsH protease activity modulator HflK [Candidatus Omnitrophota bacterium]